MLWSSWSFECITFDYFLGISFDCMAFWLFARSEVVLYDSFCEHRGIEHHGSKDRCSRVGWTKSRETGALLSFNTHDTCILRAIQGVVHPQMHTPNIYMGYTGEKFNPRILSRFFSLKRRLEKNPWQFSPSAWPPFWRYAMYYEFWNSWCLQWLYGQSLWTRLCWAYEGLDKDIWRRTPHSLGWAIC